jgi:hypothetical protein
LATSLEQLPPTYLPAGRSAIQIRPRLAGGMASLRRYAPLEPVTPIERLPRFVLFRTGDSRLLRQGSGRLWSEAFQTAPSRLTKFRQDVDDKLRGWPSELYCSNMQPGSGQVDPLLRTDR